MIKTLLIKELKAILLSPKFVATYIVFTILLLLSTYTGIQEYQALTSQYETGVQMADQRIREETSWGGIDYTTYREPDPMQIFVSGLNYDIGRLSTISPLNTVKLRQSVYSDDPIFAIFRMIDFSFVIQIVLSLLAILFTYDAINGEREGGTLKLVFSNSVSRARYLFAKATGAWLGLAAPILLAIAVSLLVVLAYNVPLTATHWVRLATLIGTSLLYFTAFIMIGLAISTLARRSSISFLLSLVFWVLFVLITPRAAVMAAGHIVHVPAVAEIEGARDAFAKDQWEAHYKRMEGFWDDINQDRNEGGEPLGDDEMWSHMQAQDSLRREVEREIEDYELRLQEDLRSRKAAQERLALTMSRISPASAYQLVAAELAETDLAMKRRYEDAMAAYRTEFVNYVDSKSEGAGRGHMIAITMDSETGFNVSTPRDQTVIDVSDMPRFTPPERSLSNIMDAAVIDLGLLILWAMVAFLIAFIRFLRYDLR